MLGLCCTLLWGSFSGGTICHQYPCHSFPCHSLVCQSFACHSFVGKYEAFGGHQSCGLLRMLCFAFDFPFPLPLSCPCPLPFIWTLSLKSSVLLGQVQVAGGSWDGWGFGFSGFSSAWVFPLPLGGSVGDDFGSAPLGGFPFPLVSPFPWPFLSPLF